MGLQHPWILVPATDTRTNPPQITSDNCILVGQKMFWILSVEELRKALYLVA